jgi:predicted transcriptional regulator
MRSADTVLTAKTNQKLEDIIPMLNKVSGLPVVDASDRVIGVISRKVSWVADSVAAAAAISCCMQLLLVWTAPQPSAASAI